MLWESIPELELGREWVCMWYLGSSWGLCPLEVSLRRDPLSVLRKTWLGSIGYRWYGTLVERCGHLQGCRVVGGWKARAPCQPGE